ncbi:MAG: copper resistance protein CopC, partial [Chloroflexi bacterium]|nr:copper resistance protein CopC [Chloroflexota bacterium]
MKIHQPSGLLVAAGALCLLIAVAAAFGVSRAQAHGVQVASDPPPDAQLEDSPALITVTFNEPIEPSVSSIQLWDQTAQPVALGALAFPEASIMTVQVPGELSPGIYTVIWRNLSTVDGHTWSGSYPITILGPGGELPDAAPAGVVAPPTQTSSGNPSTLESAARWVVLLGSAVMLGGTAYVLFVVAPAARVLAPEAGAALRGLSRTVLLMTVTIAGFLVLEGSLLQIVVLAERLGGLGRADELLLDTRLGHYLIARQGLLAVAALAVGLVWWARGRRGETPALLLLLTASFGVLLTQSLVSHAAASDGPFWTT